MMKLRYLLCLLLLLTLVACGNNATPTPRPTATEVPAVDTPREAPTQPPAAPTEPPPADTVAPPPTEPPPTEKPAEPTATTAPTDTAPASTNTSAPRPRATATSAGPLQAAIYVANCRSEPSAEKPGRVVVQISVEATGGNGKYAYTYQNKNYPTKFIDVIGEKGTRSIGEVFITSGDQTLKKEFDFNPADLTCP